VEPLEIEEAAMRSRVIEQIVVIGQVLKFSQDNYKNEKS